MIKIKHTAGEIAAKDLKKVPPTFIAKHSNGIEWIYFETTEEYENYKSEHFPKEILEGDINE